MKFPDMLAMTRESHAHNVNMGWYMNNCGCLNEELQAWGDVGGTPEMDVAAAAGLEFDGLKIDGCGPAHNMSRWSQAVKASGRSILLENCANNGDGMVWTPAAPQHVETCDFQFYRTSADIAPHYNSVMWNLQQSIPFLDPIKPLSRPGCWAYADMMQVGSNKYGSLSTAESRSHFAAWCITSSPLILGFDLTSSSLLDAVYPIISNSRAIAVNQAWHGHPGWLVRNSLATVRLGVPHGAFCPCCDNL